MVKFSTRTINFSSLNRRMANGNKRKSLPLYANKSNSQTHRLSGFLRSKPRKSIAPVRVSAVSSASSIKVFTGILATAAAMLAYLVVKSFPFLENNVTRLSVL